MHAGKVCKRYELHSTHLDPKSFQFSLQALAESDPGRVSLASPRPRAGNSARRRGWSGQCSSFLLVPTAQELITMCVVRPVQTCLKLSIFFFLTHTHFKSTYRVLTEQSDCVIPSEPKILRLVMSSMLLSCYCYCCCVRSCPGAAQYCGWLALLCSSPCSCPR